MATRSSSAATASEPASPALASANAAPSSRRRWNRCRASIRKMGKNSWRPRRQMPSSMRLFPIVGCVRFDVKGQRKCDGRERRLFHDLVDHREGALDLAFRNLKDKLVMDL